MNKNPLLVIFFTVFIDLVGFGMIIPLSPYLATHFGAGAFEVGLLMAAYSAMQFLVAPMWGRLSDRIGRRPVILISLLGSSVAHLVFGLAGSLPLLYVSRLMAGACGANISTAMAYIADVTEEKERSKGMGIVGAAFGLGFVLGPGLGGYFAQFGFSWPAYIASAICFTNFLFAIFVLKETRKVKAQPRPRESRFAKLARHFKAPTVGLLMLSAFLVSFSLANMEASLFLLMKDRFDWDLQTSSYGFAYVGIIMAFTQGYLIRKFIPKFGEKKLILTGAALFGTGMFFVGATHDIWMIALAMTALAVGNGFFNPSVLGLVSVASPKDQQGEVMGVMQSLSALARILGPPAGGWLYQELSWGSPFYLAAILSAGVFIGLIPLLRKQAGPQKAAAAAPAAALPSDPLEIDLFQLQNIVQNQVPYLLFGVGPRNPMGIVKTGLLNRLEHYEGPDLAAELESRNVEKDFPIIVVCENGETSLDVARKVEQRGFRNVYVLNGGWSRLA